MILILWVSAAMAIGTWLIGWWAVPLVAIVASIAYEGGRSARIALAAMIAWAVLLAIDILAGPFGQLTTLLGGAMGVPGPVLVILTLLFPAIVSWSAATAAGAAVAALLRRRRSRMV